MAEHNELGKDGENEAALYLKKKGYTILEQDWKFGKRDIDIIALNETGAILVFVEVKTRRNNEYTNPEDAVDRKKMVNIRICANAYVKAKNVPNELRFDIISIIGRGSQNMKIEHIEDAFNPLLVR